MIHKAGVLLKSISPFTLLIDRVGCSAAYGHFGTASRARVEAWDPDLAYRREAFLFVSPEQTGWNDRPIDSRSDMYSLGCVLCLLLTGQHPLGPPFTAAFDALAAPNTPPEVINTLPSLPELASGHIAAVPVPMQGLRAGVPVPVAAILRTLLAKDPAARYQTARGLFHDLLLCRAALRGRQPLHALALRTRDRSPQTFFQRLAAPSLFGREATCVRLVGPVFKASRTCTQYVLVAGPPGIGKTALVRRCMARMEAQGALCVGAKFSRTQLAAYHGFVTCMREIVARQLALRPEAFTAVRSRFAAVFSTEEVASLLKWVPEIAPLAGFDTPHTHAAMEPDADLAAGVESKACFLALAARFLAFFMQAPQAPLVLFLDDMQWASHDKELLEELLLSPSLAHRNLVLMVAYRDEEPGGQGHHDGELGGEEHRVRSCLNRLAAQAPGAAYESHVEILRPLTPGALGEWLADLLEAPSCAAVADLAAVLHAKTLGNPFVVATMLRQLYASRVLLHDPPPSLSLASCGDWAWDMRALAALPLADNAVELAAQTIRGFSADSHRVLQAAAALAQFRPSFRIADLCAVINQSDSLLGRVALLSSPDTPSGGTYSIPTRQSSAERSVPKQAEDNPLAPPRDAFSFAQAIAAIEPPLRDAVLVKRPDASLAFGHDRLQEACYALLPGAHAVQRMHLRIALALLALDEHASRIRRSSAQRSKTPSPVSSITSMWSAETAISDLGLSPPTSPTSPSRARPFSISTQPPFARAYPDSPTPTPTTPPQLRPGTEPMSLRAGSSGSLSLHSLGLESPPAVPPASPDSPFSPPVLRFRGTESPPRLVPWSTPPRPAYPLSPLPITVPEQGFPHPRRRGSPLSPLSPQSLVPRAFFPVAAIPVPPMSPSGSPPPPLLTRTCSAPQAARPAPVKPAPPFTMHAPSPPSGAPPWPPPAAPRIAWDTSRVFPPLAPPSPPTRAGFVRYSACRSPGSNEPRSLATPSSAPSVVSQLASPPGRLGLGCSASQYSLASTASAKSTTTTVLFPRKLRHCRTHPAIASLRTRTRVPQRLLEIADHLNLALGLVLGGSDALVRDALDINVLAGEHSKRTSAFDAAARYYSFARKALVRFEPEIWQDPESVERSLAFLVLREQAECLGFARRFEEAAACFPPLIVQCRTPAERSAVYAIRSKQAALEGKFPDALRLASEGVGLLDPAPCEDSGARLDGEPCLPACVASQCSWIERRLAALSRQAGIDPSSDDAPERLLAALVQNSATASGVPVTENLENEFSLLVSIWIYTHALGRHAIEAAAHCRMMRLGLETHDADFLISGFAHFGILCSKITREYARGYHFAHAATLLVEHLTDPMAKCRILVIFGAVVNPWHRPIRAGLPSLERNLRLSYQCGDRAIFCAGAMAFLWSKAIAGVPLDALMDDVRRWDKSLSRASPELHRSVIRPVFTQAVLHLRGETLAVTSFDTAEWSEAAHWFPPQQGHMPVHFCWVACAKLRGLYLLGCTRHALYYAEHLCALLDAIRGQLVACDAACFACLTFLACLRALGQDTCIEAIPPAMDTASPTRWTRRMLLDACDSAAAQLEEWAGTCPDNFLARHLLVQGERLRLEGDLDGALDAYGRSIAASEEQGALHTLALGYELSAQTLLGSPTPCARLAREFVRSACSTYERWGAFAKLAQLASVHGKAMPKAYRACADELHLSHDGNPSDELDIRAILRSSRELPADPAMSATLRRLVHQMLVMSGAHGCRLLLSETPDGPLYVEAEGVVQQRSDLGGSMFSIEVQQHTLAKRADLSLGLVETALRLRKALVIWAESENGARRGSVVDPADPSRPILLPDPVVDVDLRLVPTGCLAFLCVPIFFVGAQRCAVVLTNRSTPHVFAPHRLRLIALMRAQVRASLRNALDHERLGALHRRREAADWQYRALFDEAPVPTTELDFTSLVERGRELIHATTTVPLAELFAAQPEVAHSLLRRLVVLGANMAFLKTTGLDADALPAFPCLISALYDPERIRDIASFAEFITAVVNGATEWMWAGPSQLLGEHRTVRLQVTRIDPEERAEWHGLVSLIDITGHVQATADLKRRLDERSEQLRESNQQLLASWEQEEVSQRQREAEEIVLRQKHREFFDFLCHELRNPLAGIIGSIELINERVGALWDASFRENLSDLETSAAQIKALVDDVLDFSKIEANEINVESCPACLMDVVIAALRRFAAQTRCIVCECPQPGHPTPQLTDASRLPAEDSECVWTPFFSVHRPECSCTLPWAESDPVCDPALRRVLMVRTDPYRLEQILHHLLTHASERSFQGSLRIRACALGDGTRLALTITNPEAPLTEAERRLCMTATACGDPARETKGRITASSRLSFAIARKLVDLMGGEITAHPYPPNTPCSPTRMKSLDPLSPDTLLAAPALSACVSAPVPGVPVSPVPTPLAHFSAPLPPTPPPAPDHLGTASAPGSTLYFSCSCRPCTEDEIGALLAPPGRASPLPPASPVPLGVVAGERAVLVVDDNIVNLRVVQGFLSALRVVTATDGLQAVQTWEKDPLGFALILMDVEMPTMSGLEATARIRQREAEHGAPRVPIVALTGAARRDDRERFLDAGMNAVITKPILKASLLRVVREWMTPPNKD